MDSYEARVPGLEARVPSLGFESQRLQSSDRVTYAVPDRVLWYARETGRCHIEHRTRRTSDPAPMGVPRGANG